MSLQHWGLLILLAWIWGSSFFFTAIAVQEIPPMTMAAGRISIASLFLLAVTFALRLPWPKELNIYTRFFVVGVLNNAIPFSLISYSQTMISSSMASVMNSTVPLITIIVSHFWPGKERATLAKVLGVAIGMTGVVLLFIERIGGNDLTGFIGQLLIILACFGYAFANIIAKIDTPPHPITGATLITTAGAIVIIPVALYVDGPFVMPSTPALIALLCSGLISTAAAYIVYFLLLNAVGPTNISLVTFLIPLVSIFLGGLFLQETLSMTQILGMLIIFAGLFWIQQKPVPKAADK